MENIAIRYYHEYDVFKNMIIPPKVRGVIKYHEYFSGDCHKITSIDKLIKKRRWYNGIFVYYSDDAVYVYHYTKKFKTLDVLVDDHKPCSNAHGIAKALLKAITEAREAEKEDLWMQ